MVGGSGDLRKTKKTGASPVFLLGAGVHNGLDSVFTQEPNRSPAERVRFGKEEQRHERALPFEKSRSKRYRACSDVVEISGIEPLTS